MPSTARTAPTWRWKMIPCVSGKCIFSALTSRRFFPLSMVAVLRIRTKSGSAGFFVVVTAISAPLHRGRRRHVAGLRLGRKLRDFLLDLFDDAHVADLFVPVRVDEPSTLLRAPAPSFVVGFGVRDVHELRFLLAADVAPVLATRLESATRRRRDQVGREAFDRHELRLAPLVEARDGTEEAPRVGHLRICEELGGVGL